MFLDVKPVVYLCDAIVDVVDSEIYLGNKLYNNLYKTKILFIRFQCAIVLL